MSTKKHRKAKIILIGEEIRELRKQKKMSQAEFGRLLGIKGNTLSDIERGVRAPTKRLLMLLQTRFHVSFGEDWTQETLSVSEGPVSYKARPKKLHRLLQAVIEIMNSDSDVEKTALAANVEAFVQSVRLRREVQSGGEEAESQKKSTMDGGEN